MSNPGEIVFSYSRSPEYRIIAANGAFGGVTPRGDFRMDLFVESNGIPEKIIHSMTPDGLGPEIGREPPPPDLVREIQVGVVLQIDQAKSLAHWILDNISRVEAARAQGKS